ncbi:hypothetical protein SARC_06527, partial [Sphaeroforma arctica JP610]
MRKFIVSTDKQRIHHRHISGQDTHRRRTNSLKYEHSLNHRTTQEIDTRSRSMVSEPYDKAMKNCDKSDPDECIALSGFMNELTLVRSHEGNKTTDQETDELLKMSEFPKWPASK